MKLKWIWLSNLRIWPGNPILGSRLYESGIYQSPTSFFYLFYSNQRGGGGLEVWALVPHNYASDSGAARICQRGPKRGSDREILFENWCMKTAFSCTLKCHNSMGVGYVKWHIIPIPIYSPFWKIILLQSTGRRGHGRLYPLAICQW